MISNLKFQISNSLVKLRALPEHKKKIIFFSIIAASALIIGYFEVQATRRDIAKLQESLRSTSLPSIDFSLDEERAPKLDMDNINTVLEDMQQEKIDQAEAEQEKIQQEEINQTPKRPEEVPTQN